nr:MAG TPA: hypothetical protein [Caudoviricetes sp.]
MAVPEYETYLSLLVYFFIENKRVIEKDIKHYIIMFGKVLIMVRKPYGTQWLK